MNQENRPPSHDLNYEKYMFMTFRKKLENNNEEQSSVTPKRPLLSRDRDMLTTFNEISPLSDHNSRFEQTKSIYLPTTPIELIKNDPSLISVTEHRVFAISPPASSRSTVIDDDDDDDNNSYMPVYTQRKARPAPPTTWKAPNPIPKSSTMLKTNTASSLSLPELIPAPPLISFQPAIRARIPFNLSSTNTIDKQTHAYTIWLNSLFTPVEFLSNTTTTTTNQSISNESTITRSFKSLAESNRWYILRDRAREILHMRYKQ